MKQIMHGSYIKKQGVRLLTATVICFAVGLAMPPSARAEVVARYAFTTDVSDSIGVNTNPIGILMNGAYVSGGSVVLDGTDEYVDLGTGISSSIISNLGDSSFETWVTWTGSGDFNQQIFDFGNGVDPGTGLPYNHMYMTANAPAAFPINSNLTFTLGSVLEGPPLGTSLTHIVVTLDQAGFPFSATGIMYVNGISVNINSGMSTTSSLGSTIYNYLGKFQDDSNPYYNGGIGDFRVWNHALTQAEVTAHYNAGADGMAVWNGDGNFNSTANWDTNVLPGAGTTAYIASGTMNLNGTSTTVAGLRLLGGLVKDTGSGLLTSSSNIVVYNGEISAKLGGTSGLTKTAYGTVETGTVRLSGANTFTGGVTLNAGELQLGHSSALGSNTNVLTMSGASTILNIDLSSVTLGGLTLIDGTIQSNLSSATITSTSAFDLRNGMISVRMGGSKGLIKSGTGTVVLAGSGNSYSGGTTVAAGTLSVYSASRLGSNATGNNIRVLDGAGLILAAPLNIGANQDLNIDYGGIASATYAVDNTLVGKLGSSGSGVLALMCDDSNNLNFSTPSFPVSLGALGGTYIYSGTLTPVNNTYRLGGAGGTLNMNTNLVDDGATERSVVICGGGTPGTVLFTGTNTYTGGTTVNDGTLRLGNDTALPSIGILKVNGGTMDLGAYTPTVSGVVLNGGIISNGTITSTTTYDLRSGSALALLAQPSGVTLGINKTTSGTVYLGAADNAFSGQVYVTGGRLDVMKLANGGVASSIGASSAASTSLTIGSDTATATLRYIGTGDSTDRCFRLGLSGAIESSGSGAIDFTPEAGMGMGWVGTGAHTLTLTGSNTGDNIMNVSLVDTDDGLGTTYATSLVKDGDGKWMSTINHLYTGNTTVLAGNLDLMDINTPDATVTVQAGELDAASVVTNILTIGEGAKLVIKPRAGVGPSSARGTLTPIPEPSTWAMLMLAAMGLGIHWRRGR